jgi:hypothetical protein
MPWLLVTFRAYHLVLATWDIHSKRSDLCRKKNEQKALKVHFLERIPQVASTGVRVTSPQQKPGAREAEAFQQYCSLAPGVTNVGNGPKKSKPLAE